MSIPRARAIQEELRSRVIREGSLPDLGLIAGADVAYSGGRGKAYAAVVVLDFPGLHPVEEVTATLPVRFPYVPGLLSFREAPALLEAFRRLRCRPDAVIFDAQGYAHPRRFGLASHVALILDLPAVGCAKSRLIGEHGEPRRHAGASSPLLDGGELIGRVLRTRTGVRPVYVSIGHRLSLESCTDLVLRCITRWRLPEPIRRAHALVSTLRRR